MTWSPPLLLMSRSAFLLCDPVFQPHHTMPRHPNIYKFQGLAVWFECPACSVLSAWSVLFPSSDWECWSSFKTILSLVAAPLFFLTLTKALKTLLCLHIMLNLSSLSTCEHLRSHVSFTFDPSTQIGHNKEREMSHLANSKVSRKPQDSEKDSEPQSSSSYCPCCSFLCVSWGLESMAFTFCLVGTSGMWYECKDMQAGWLH